ncbi:major facilitator superfamily domain-containing protein [Apiosordaria backusii]|uniref:Major facilitator superfamily domain-containing protein n=1 Tax=Apiosordaria backusii TaxID=314023 RepID=A0AA40EEP4_9PEZI|nr:major facilitator superfamily domain-containing protein [Apiosordaria backusii]
MAEINNEYTPLISPPGPSNIAQSGSDNGVGGTSLSSSNNPLSSVKRLYVMVFCLSLVILQTTGLTLADTPLTEIQERIICQQIHGLPLQAGGANPCKDNDVQGELSTILGWKITLSLIPSLLMAVPYGAGIDRFGRRPFLGLCFVGLSLSAGWDAVVCAFPSAFPLRFIWLDCLFLFIGGGTTVLSAVLYTIVSDISTESQRSTTFFYLGSAVMGGALVANPITYLAMQKGLWFSVFTGLICLAATTLLAFCIPQTLCERSSIAIPEPEAPSDRQHDQKGYTLRRLVCHIQAGLSQTSRTAQWMFLEQRLVGLLLFSIMLEVLGRDVVIVTMQYVTKRLEISWAEAGLVDSVGSLFQLGVLLFLLPLVSQLLLLRLGLSARSKDLRLAQVSAVLTALGITIVGLASKLSLLITGLAVASLGTGYTFLLRGLMTSLVAGHDTGLLYTSIAIVETAVVLLAGPLYSGLFRIGLSWGDDWVGFPFMVAGCILILAAALVGAVRLSDTAEEPASGTEDLSP